MLAVDEIVDAVCERLEQYGAYFKHADDNILVMSPDISWQSIGHPSDTRSTAARWAYDNASRLTSSTFTANGTATYGYDSTNQLVSANYTGTNAPPNARDSFDKPAADPSYRATYLLYVRSHLALLAPDRRPAQRRWTSSLSGFVGHERE